MDAASQNAQLPSFSTTAEGGSSYMGPMFSPGGSELRGLHFPHSRLPTTPLQYDMGAPPTQQPRSTQMNMEPGQTHFVPLRNFEHLAVDRSRGVRVDFPRFDGVNPRGWLRNCHRYFMLNPMSNIEKILLASMHLEGKAKYWYMDNVEGREFMGWTVFSNMLIERFLEGEGENLIGDFNKLVQEDSVEELSKEGGIVTI